MSDLVGKALGQYKVIELIGKGGMATVYKAHQSSLNRYVALKVLPEYMAHDEEFVKRFRQEAEASAALRHPNIIVIYDIGEAANVHYIATELLEGQTLERVLRQGGALPLPRVVKIVNQLASALEAAHQRDMIHRDVKPSNVFVGPNDHVTLMDFGIVKAMAASRLTRTGTLIGTPEYMSPEQADGQPLDRRSDLYSLGVVVYQMLTGKAPFTAATPNAVLYAHVNKSPLPPSQLNTGIPQPVEAVILRALAKRPEERFQSTSEFAAAMEKAARQVEGELAAGMYREAQRLASSGKPLEAQAKLEQLRQISPSYPGLHELAGQINQQAQVEREYVELAKQVKQARERAADFSRRVPRHPDPERVLASPAAPPARPGGIPMWSMLWAAGLALAMGGLLGYWYVSEESWAAGFQVLFGGGESLKENDALVPWVAVGSILFIAIASAAAAFVRHKAVTRVLALIGVALAVLGFVMTALMLQDRGFGELGTGPMLVLVGQVMMGLGLMGRAWRGARV